MSQARPSAPRRERARAATIEEIKHTALAVMREHGNLEVRFTDIARAMDMTPPALYRYFADRDELLYALIADAYEALGSHVAESRRGVPPGDVAAAWLAAGHAYRRWAHQEPQQFALILGLPLPGYTVIGNDATAEAASRAMAQLSSLFVEALQLGLLRPPLIRDVHPSMAECAQLKSDAHGIPLPTETFQAMMHAWSSLHGFTSLEIHGYFDWMTPEARDALFVGQLRLAAEASGLPTTR